MGLWKSLNSSDLFQDRPAMQLYQPGARSRSRLCQYEDSAAKPADQGADKKQESETSNTKEEEWLACKPYVFWLSVQPKSMYYAIQKCLRSEEGTKEEKGALCCWMFLVKSSVVDSEFEMCSHCIFSYLSLFSQHLTTTEKRIFAK